MCREDGLLRVLEDVSAVLASEVLTCYDMVCQQSVDRCH